jgi:GT2 family glycosyltransferase
VTKILVSIIAFNRLELTRKCVESVLRAREYSDDWQCQITLQNNGSTDGVREFFAEVERAHTDTHVVNYERNTGFQIPTEAAFVMARALDCDYLVCVNNDCTIPANALELMIAEFQRNPTLALVGSKSGCCTLADNLHGYEGGSVEYVELSCAMIDVRKVAKHYDRLFDERLHFAYGEDAHLSLKMRKLGYSVARANFHIEHERGSTSIHVPEAFVAQRQNHEALKVIWAHYLKTRTFRYRIVVRRMASLGDVILTTPVIRKLWEENPLSEIVVETQFADVFNGNPCVAYAARSIGRRPDDLVIGLDMTSENGILRHFVASYARAAGVNLERPWRTECFWREEDYVETPVPFGPTCAMHVGPTTWSSKNYPMSRFLEIAEAMRSEGWTIYLVGKDNPNRPDIGRWVSTPRVNQLAAFLANCDLFLGLDSGCLHAAQAVGTPVIGLFGVTSSRYILTDGSPAIGLDADPVAYPRAGERHRVAGVTHIEEDGTTIASITVAQVMEAVRKLCPKKAEAIA